MVAEDEGVDVEEEGEEEEASILPDDFHIVSGLPDISEVRPKVTPAEYVRLGASTSCAICSPCCRPNASPSFTRPRADLAERMARGSTNNTWSQRAHVRRARSASGKRLCCFKTRWAGNAAARGRVGDPALLLQASARAERLYDR